jgi:hypothetical protein
MKRYTLINSLGGLAIFCFILNMQGCSSTTMGIYQTSYYQNQLKSARKIRIGEYWTSGGINSVFYNRGPIADKEIISWWFTKTKTIEKYYYARSLPGKGAIAPDRHWWNDWTYKVYVGHGPMFFYGIGLSEYQKKDATFIEIWPSGVKTYSWGKPDVLHYKVLKKHMDPNIFPQVWEEIPALEISKQQYEFLNKRCYSKWQGVRCFVDENFPDLTPVQIEYVKSHKHKNDDERMSGKVAVPERQKSNSWL